jgi:glycosyltransferase involved in cell wall biosynthesis
VRHFRRTSYIQNKEIAILGTVGLPANYGGFETLTENLVRYHFKNSLPSELTVYCSKNNYPLRPETFESARLRYMSGDANGVGSISYDIRSLISAIWHRSNVILLLGVSGAIALPVIRLLSSAVIITNIDGIEWRREKWSALARRFLRFSEMMAVRFSHKVIADNDAIAVYVKDTYDVYSHVIAYGGDHATAVSAVPVNEYALPDSYAFSVCRIEPENNIDMIVRAFATGPSISLVIVGNWQNSEYGRALQRQYADCENVYLLDPIYDLGKLKTLRSGAMCYVHGHSAGGTNPALVEAMQFGRPIFAFDCDFNRRTTADQAIYFSSSEDLSSALSELDTGRLEGVGLAMRELAESRYQWHVIARQYFELM